MGIGKNERREALARQDAVLAENKRKAAEEEAYLKAERAKSEAEQAKYTPIQEAALARVKGYDTGKDISGLYPGLSSVLGQTARSLKASQRMPGALGKDARYNARLMGSRQGELNTSLGELMANAATQKRAEDLNEAMGITNVGSAERGFRTGSFQQLMNTAGQQFGEATQKRQMAIDRGRAGMQDLLSGISTGASVAGSFMGGIGALKQAGNLGKINETLRGLPPPKR
jgi:hypothetical protein